MSDVTEAPKSNIIQFPNIHRGHQNKLPDTQPELDEEILRRKKVYLEDVSTQIMCILYDELPSHGMKVSDDTFIMADMPYVGEAIKSALFRMHGIPHAFQEAADIFEKLPDAKMSIASRVIEFDDDDDDDDFPPMVA